MQDLRKAKNIHKYYLILIKCVTSESILAKSFKIVYFADLIEKGAGSSIPLGTANIL